MKLVLGKDFPASPPQGTVITLYLNKNVPIVPACLNSLFVSTYFSFLPIGFFLTKIFHPNVASNGAICVNTLKRDWKPDHGIRHILLVSDAIIIIDLSAPYQKVLGHHMVPCSTVYTNEHYKAYDYITNWG